MRDEVPTSAVAFRARWCPGSWAWENVAPRLAESGWYGVCLNWYGHNGSEELPEQEVLTRSIPDVGREIGLVAKWLGRTPILVAHSMGGLAALDYASRNKIAALVLITPVVPKQFGETEIPVPVDAGAMWLAPAEMANQLFWDAVSPEAAKRYTSLMTPESAQAVLEATRWLVDVDTSAVSVPAYPFGADRDMLVPEGYVQSLAANLGATYTKLADQGHGVPLNPVWESVTEQIDQWLTATTADLGSSRPERHSQAHTP
ncbi:alpha/beta hydrolase [Streptomyces mirabilis]|uniref:alpha/beta hydrolase n=1 Tax=Streptomyces mirabilis TaxID=68239 RepID=UPI0021C226CA|nr:alpha/beta hydrolase [Streptomyces mirabilis]MCT9113453.1 alpha/beta hydrolase [Streptomyces mirabilis]